MANTAVPTELCVRQCPAPTAYSDPWPTANAAPSALSRNDSIFAFCLISCMSCRNALQCDRILSASATSQNRPAAGCYAKQFMQSLYKKQVPMYLDPAPHCRRPRRAEQHSRLGTPTALCQAASKQNPCTDGTCGS